MTTLRPKLLAAALLTCLVALVACSGGDKKTEKDPAQTLAAAKKTLDETSGVHIVLSTVKLPDGVSGVLRADGFGTHAPAFQGSIKVSYSGIIADVPIVAVGGVVYAQLPFTTKFTRINPKDYGAPDPASLLDASKGLSTWLAKVEGVRKGEQRRDGQKVLTSYTGTLPAEAVTGIIPSAAKTPFDVVFTVTDADQLDQAVVTGPFYNDQKVTYTVTFDQYGTVKDIKAP